MPDPGGPRHLRRWFAAALVATAAAASLVSLEVAARSARTIGRAVAIAPGAVPVVLVRRNADVVAVARERSLRGRVFLHVGRYLHFQPHLGPPVAALAAPGGGAETTRVLLEEAGPRNHLWVAAATGAARRVFYLSPPGMLHRRLVDLGRSMDELPLAIDAEAFPRTLDAAAPRLGEPVVLDVNASWFDEADAERLVALLRKAGVRTDLAILSLAEGSPDVSDDARERLREFAARLAGASPEVRP